MTEPVDKAAQWLAATPQHKRPHPIIPHLRETFGLTAKQVCDAIRAANELRRAH